MGSFSTLHFVAPKCTKSRYKVAPKVAPKKLPKCFRIAGLRIIGPLRLINVGKSSCGNTQKSSEPFKKRHQKRHQISAEITLCILSDSSPNQCRSYRRMQQYLPG
jgi:hypothetical protein